MLATEKNLVWRYPSDVDRETVNTFTIICFFIDQNKSCLLYTSDAADEL